MSALLAALALLLALALHPTLGGLQGPGLILGAATLLGLCVAVGVSLRALTRTRLPAADPSERRARGGLLVVWCGLTLCGWASWPAGLRASEHPLASLFLFGSLLALPAGLVEARGPRGPLRELETGPAWGRALEIYVRVVFIVGLGFGTLVVLRYVRDMRPLVGDVDFYFYICVARDLEDGLRDTSLFRYAYFPGVYVFWRGVMRLLGRAVSDLQTAYVGLLLANACLVGAIVWRVLGSVAPAAHAALWYLILCPRFEGLSGVTEPLATLAPLASLLLWQGKDLRGSAGVLRGMALGAGLGLAVYAKQQGALFLGGIAGLLLTSLRGPRHRSPQAAPLLALTLSSALAFVVAVLLEGQGLRPLRLGAWLAAHSHQEGSFLPNLARAAAQSWPLSACVVLCFAAWTAATFGPWTRRLAQEEWLRMGGVCLFSGLATLLQFVRTPYLHYGLLGIPFLVIATWITIVGLFRQAPHLVARPLTGILAAVLATVLLLRTEPRPRFVELWPPDLSRRPAYTNRWEDIPDIARDLQALERLLSPGEDLLVFPPRRNAIHYRLGTRCLSFPQGYGWTPQPRAVDTLRTRGPDAVLVIEGYLSAVDHEVCAWHGCREAVRELPQAGYEKVAVLNAMTLWRRSDQAQR